MQEETEFLGHVLTKHGIKMNAGLVKAIQEWPTPRRQRHVMQFLGLCQYYHQHIDHYADLALPLTTLLAASSTFHWDQAQQDSFEALKKAVTTAPILHIFDPALFTAVETDASGFAVGAVLFQRDADGTSHPVAYTSRKMNAAERNYPTHEQELLAVVHALKTWRYYLDGTHFIVYTDHATLRHFPTQPNLTRRQARWMELFQEYDFDFRYKPGKDNIVPDALSRRPDYQWTAQDLFQLHNLTIDFDPDTKRRFVELYPKDPQLGPLLEQYRNSSPKSRYYVDDGLLWTRIAGSIRLCVPQDPTLRTLLLHDHHDAPIAGHLGFDKTYDALRRTYFWPRMARDTKAYVNSCEQCQRNKPILHHKAGLFTPLEIPSQRWETVSMDFIVQLPKTAHGYDAITVFVDKLSKQVHFCASHTTDSAADVARLFFDQVFRLHGMPRAFISDRDTKFTSKFWMALTKLLGIKQNMSTAFHPQSDGQTERANRTLEEMLRSYISYHQRDWDKFLSMMEFAYNNSINPTTGVSPFLLNQGFHPLVPASLISPTTTPAPAVADFIQQQSSVLALAQDAIAQAQLQQKHYADKFHQPVSFTVGDMVLLSTEHISAAAHANRPSKKLEPNFVGPFKIIEAINDNAFKLDLPSSMHQHPVFNADLLKPYKPSPSMFPDRTPPRPPPILVDDNEEYEVDDILDYKIIRGSPKWLVKWKGYPLDDATWEPKRALKNAHDILSAFESKRTK
jgi:transposase InsO family protein